MLFVRVSFSSRSRSVCENPLALLPDSNLSAERQYLGRRLILARDSYGRRCSSGDRAGFPSAAIPTTTLSTTSIAGTSISPQTSEPAKIIVASQRPRMQLLPKLTMLRPGEQHAARSRRVSRGIRKPEPFVHRAGCRRWSGRICFCEPQSFLDMPRTEEMVFLLLQFLPLYPVQG